MSKLITTLTILLCLFAGAAFSQTTTGSVTGTVTDPSGAVVTNVKVTAAAVATGVQTTAETNSAGVFNLLFLPVGNYTVSAESQGFKKAVIGPPFALEVNQIARVDIKHGSGRYDAIGGDHRRCPYSSNRIDGDRRHDHFDEAHRSAAERPQLRLADASDSWRYQHQPGSHEYFSALSRLRVATRRLMAIVNRRTTSCSMAST